jgi:hypothetical protein
VDANQKAKFKNVVSKEVSPFTTTTSKNSKAAPLAGTAF